ncbi:hypothetical protein D3C72_648480 [compost metagenome]
MVACATGVGIIGPLEHQGTCAFQQGGQPAAFGKPAAGQQAARRRAIHFHRDNQHAPGAAVADGIGGQHDGIERRRSPGTDGEVERTQSEANGDSGRDDIAGGVG